MSTYSDSLSEEHKKALETFRKTLLAEGIISEEGDTLGTQHDWVLMRFIRARQYNLDKAKYMITKCIEWRETVLDVGLDELYRRFDAYDYPERSDVFKFWPVWYHKTDKRGRPINIQTLGGIDATGLAKIISPERHWESLVVTAEALVREVLPACSYAANRLIDEVLVIVDLKNFGLSKFWQMKNLARDCFQISQDYYPETMGQLYIINAPYTFTAIWNVMRPWLARETQEKVKIFGSDYGEALLEIIDEDSLPASLGGSCTCEEAGGCLVANAGPWMDKRKERREKWLKGESPRPGLSLEDREQEKEKQANLDTTANRRLSSSPGIHANEY